MDSSTPAYGLWSLVILNAAFFIFFAFSFTKPKTPRDRRSFGAFAAFIGLRASEPSQVKVNWQPVLRSEP